MDGAAKERKNLLISAPNLLTQGATAILMSKSTLSALPDKLSQEILVVFPMQTAHLPVDLTDLPMLKDSVEVFVVESSSSMAVFGVHLAMIIMELITILLRSSANLLSFHTLELYGTTMEILVIAWDVPKTQWQLSVGNVKEMKILYHSVPEFHTLKIIAILESKPMPCADDSNIIAQKFKKFK